MQAHLTTKHERKPARVCIYCKKVFINEKDFKSHFQNEHTLPIAHSNDSLTSKSNSAVRNMFKTLQLEGDDSIDLIQFVLRKEPVIRQTLLESTTFG